MDRRCSEEHFSTISARAIIFVVMHVPNRGQHSSEPTLDEQISVVGSMLEGLRHSFTHVAGEHEGQITDADVLREIECLEATRRILIGVKAAPAPPHGDQLKLSHGSHWPN